MQLGEEKDQLNHLKNHCSDKSSLGKLSLFNSLVFYKCTNQKLTKASQGIKKSWMIRKKRGKVNFEVFLLNSIDMGLEDPT